MLNGVILLGAERLRRNAEVRALALREGVKEDGGRKLETLEFKEAAVIGLAESSALIPGISRDGVAMSAGLARGLDNADAARYAFLLATPIILAAGLFKLSDLTGPLGDHGVRRAALIAALCAAVAGVFTVHFLTRYFRTRNLIPFGIYCLLFGAAMVIYIQA
jgi:undecaprenyl-diphosphatase